MHPCYEQQKNDAYVQLFRNSLSAHSRVPSLSEVTPFSWRGFQKLSPLRERRKLSTPREKVHANGRQRISEELNICVIFLLFLCVLASAMFFN